jgi:hypothetical protein
MRFLPSAAGGAVLGYGAVRAFEALREIREPATPLAKDPIRYGRLRRSLMLLGMARSLAELASAAYLIGPRLEPPPGEREARLRRIALVAGGLVLSTLVELPTDFIEGFAVERRYGLSKQSARAWLLERIKGLGLSLAIATPLIELLAEVIERAPGTWPVLATAGSLPLLILANVIAPLFIAPLFNRFEPIEGTLADDIRALADRFGAGDAAILRVDMSKQTEKANAYVTGLFGTKRNAVRRRARTRPLRQGRRLARRRARYRIGGGRFSRRARDRVAPGENALERRGPRAHLLRDLAARHARGTAARRIFARARTRGRHVRGRSDARRTGGSRRLRTSPRAQPRRRRTAALDGSALLVASFTAQPHRPSTSGNRLAAPARRHDYDRTGIL